jgi:hypothetical protein
MYVFFLNGFLIFTIAFLAGFVSGRDKTNMTIWSKDKLMNVTVFFMAFYGFVSYVIDLAGVVAK